MHAQKRLTASAAAEGGVREGSGEGGGGPLAPAPTTAAVEAAE